MADWMNTGDESVTPGRTGSLEDREARLRNSALAARGISKAFPGVVANDHVDFEVLKGEVHALLGENGSGKTTLCKVLTGFHQPDEGQIYADGSPVVFPSPASAFEAGIFMVHQHFSLVGPLTVAENVVLGWTQDPTWRFDRRTVEEQVAAEAEKFGITIDPRAMVATLSVGEKQRVELLKALYRGARTLILDEPTSVLTPQEARQLFVTLRRMAEEGEAVVFISHKLDEVTEVCDHVSVLRQGRSAGMADLRKQRVDAKGLANLMVGRDIHLQRKAASGRGPDAGTVLEIRNLQAHDSNGSALLKGVSLDVHAGEILGVAGIAGNGQRALAEAIAGLQPYSGGEIRINGSPLPSGNVRKTIEAGVAYVPEDRLGTGLAPGMMVSENISLKSYRGPLHSIGPILRKRAIREDTRRLLADFDIKGHESSLVRQLSGGNAQKVLLARELTSDPSLIVVATPTRGLDVSAMETVRDLLAEAAVRGVAVLLISEDLGEILDLADRIAVICAGEIQGIVDAEGAELDEIGMMLMGQGRSGTSHAAV
ncbi:MAG: ABC transporter ATP-binding protein [Rhodobacteraceae bacterium]|nr:ABC transporter ATP-binding protein [Paracoccaceae bacterium]